MEPPLIFVPLDLFKERLTIPQPLLTGILQQFFILLTVVKRFQLAMGFRKRVDFVILTTILEQVLRHHPKSQFRAKTLANIAIDQ